MTKNVLPPEMKKDEFDEEFYETLERAVREGLIYWVRDRNGEPRFFATEKALQERGELPPRTLHYMTR